MNLMELKDSILKNESISQDAYSLNGGLPNEALCISFTNEKWEVYYSEKGNKTSLKMFKDESEACGYFYNKLRKMLHL